MIDRRELMAALGSALALPVTAHAQQPLPVIGYASGSVKLSAQFLTNVRKGLAEFGSALRKRRFTPSSTNF
jgi:hypothetical protein